MCKLKKSNNIIISTLLSLVLLCTAVILPYYQVKAEAITATIGVASGGVALLSLLALSGVGMELENNRKFNELSDEEKSRLENGLAQNYEEVALQRGASLEKIKSWTSDLCNGLLDKTSECWDIFKSWAKDAHISINNNRPNENGASYKMTDFIGTTWTSSSGTSYTFGLDWYDFLTRYADPSYLNADYCGVICYENQIFFISQNSNEESITKNSYAYVTSQRGTNNWSSNGSSRLTYTLGVQSYYDKITFINCSKPVYFGDNTTSNMNGLGFEVAQDIFSTNTDYLERLKGQDTETVEVIDVTDIKHPIIESIPNTKAELSYNKGFQRPTPQNDDDKIVVGGLVPTNIFYDTLDDYNDGLKNEVIIYDQTIQENPQNQDKVFVSPTPIINVNNIYNTIPVVNTPVSNTVVNKNYTYNNYYNKNVTINELPYNSELIPYLPTMLFENKFPFCIPFDIYTLFSVFYVEREAPEFTFDVPFPSENGLQVQQITLGLKDYEYCALVLRIMWYFLFLLGLMLISRKLIKG